jgi:hypothetical protein
MYNAVELCTKVFIRETRNTGEVKGGGWARPANHGSTECTKKVRTTA